MPHNLRADKVQSVHHGLEAVTLVQVLDYPLGHFHRCRYSSIGRRARTKQHHDFAAAGASAHAPSSEPTERPSYNALGFVPVSTRIRTIRGPNVDSSSPHSEQKLRPGPEPVVQCFDSIG
jgi:hypothetical protein